MELIWAFDSVQTSAIQKFTFNLELLLNSDLQDLENWSVTTPWLLMIDLWLDHFC